MIVVDPGSSGAGGVTLGDVVERTLRLLGSRDNLNQLAEGVAPTDSEVKVAHTIQGLERGSVIAIDQELLHVWDVSQQSGTITVERGVKGSEAVAHEAGDIVAINPRFARFDVVNAINDELRALSSTLWQAKTADFVWQPARIGYDFGDTTVLDGIELRWQMPTAFHEWPRLTSSQWRISHNENTLEFPSGIALFVFAGGYPGRLMRMLYKAGFNAMFNEEDDVQQVSGLHAEAADILALGAAIRLTDSLEIQRNDFTTQGDTRRPQEVPPGALLRSSADLQARRAQRIQDERAALTRRFPIRRGGW